MNNTRVLCVYHAKLKSLCGLVSCSMQNKATYKYTQLYLLNCSEFFTIALTRKHTYISPWRMYILRRKIKVKACVHSPDIPSRFRGFYINYPRYWNSLLQSHLLGENAQQFSASVAVHKIPIFVLPGNHCYWVDRGNVDSMLV